MIGRAITNGVLDLAAATASIRQLQAPVDAEQPSVAEQMGAVAGPEVDRRDPPHIFNEDPDQVILVGDSNLTPLLAHLGVGVGGSDVPVRPYVVAGVGLVRSRIDVGDLFEDVSTNQFGLTLGGGVTGMVSDNVGIRGDVRYIRSLEDPEEDDDFDVGVGKFDFWRATVGVVFSIP